MSTKPKPRKARRMGRPLLTHCDRCNRKRRCLPVWPSWLCSQCIERCHEACTTALLMFCQPDPPKAKR